MRRLISLLIALAAVLILTPGTALAAGRSSDAVILYTNDVHCQVDQTTDKGGAVTGIGYAGVAALKKEMQGLYSSVLLVDAGDHLQGGAIGTLSQGAYLVDIMNQTGYDYAAIGNHDFDYGVPRLLADIRAAHYTYLSCNFSKADGTAAEGVKAYDIREVSGVKVAFIGISTPETFTKSNPANFQDAAGNYLYSFAEGGSGRELTDRVQAAIDAARADGAQYVIALAHLGTSPASSPWTSREVIARTSGLNAVLDGHSHSTIPSETVADRDGAPVLLSSTGTKLAAVGKLVLNTTTLTATTELITGYAVQDKATGDAIADIEAQYRGLLKAVVAHTDVALTTLTPDGSARAVRSAETNLGDLCADAFRIQTGADIAFVNGGGIRADIPAGDITYEQILSVHPFGNMACVVEATGRQIADALEMAARNFPGECGGFLQVSGLTYNINPSVPSPVTVDGKGMFVSADGVRRVENVRVLDRATGEYRPLDPNGTYTLASHNFMLKSGGDGLNMFMDDRILQDDVKIDNQVLIDYIRDSLNGAVGTEYADPAGQGRITACSHIGGILVVNRKDAACAAEGYTGDTVCAVCGQLLTAGTVLPPTGLHTYANGVCTVCGAPMPAAVSPDTGDDSGISACVPVCAVCLTGLILPAVRKRKKTD